jgi:hypothetical protein
MFRYLEGKTITFDVDGVLAASHIAVVNELNKRFNLNRKPEEINNWHSITDWVLELGFGDNEARAVETDLWFGPETISRSEPVSGDPFLLYLLKEEKADIRIITGRPSRLNGTTRDFVANYFPFIDLDRVIPNPYENIKEASDFKPRRIGEIEPFAHVEDSVAQIKAILKYTRNTKIVVVPNGWNSEADNMESDRIIIARGGEKRPDLWPVYSILHTLSHNVDNANTPL